VLVAALFAAGGLGCDLIEAAWWSILAGCGKFNSSQLIRRDLIEAA